MFSMRIFALWLLLIQWTYTDGQQIVMTAPTQFSINQPMTLSCTYTPSAASETVTAFKWTYTGAAIFLTLGSTCSVIAGGTVISVTYSTTCDASTNTFTLTFPDASKETITRDWCCNVATTGAAPSNPGDCKTAVLVCPNLDNPSGGSIAYSSSSSIGSIAKYSCNSGYAIDEGSNTRTCQLDGTWNGDARTCTAPVPCLCFCQAGCTAGVIIGSIFVLSWIFAIVVICVINKEDQKLLPWNLCDGHLKKSQIWVVLFICVPYGPTCVTIYWFKTKCPGKPTKPVISHKSVSVHVGDTATFTCTSSSTVDSGLTMSYTWRRNRVDMKSEGRYMVSSETLTVTKVVKGDASDKFTCIAREGSGPPSDESDSARIVIS